MLLTHKMEQIVSQIYGNYTADALQEWKQFKKAEEEAKKKAEEEEAKKKQEEEAKAAEAEEEAKKKAEEEAKKKAEAEAKAEEAKAEGDKSEEDKAEAEEEAKNASEEAKKTKKKLSQMKLSPKSYIKQKKLRTVEQANKTTLRTILNNKGWLADSRLIMQLDKLIANPSDNTALQAIQKLEQEYFNISVVHWRRWSWTGRSSYAMAQDVLQLYGKPVSQHKDPEPFDPLLEGTIGTVDKPVPHRMLFDDICYFSSHGQEIKQKIKLYQDKKKQKMNAVASLGPNEQNPANNKVTIRYNINSFRSFVTWGITKFRPLYPYNTTQVNNNQYSYAPDKIMHPDLFQKDFHNSITIDENNKNWEKLKTIVTASVRNKEQFNQLSIEEKKEKLEEIAKKCSKQFTYAETAEQNKEATALYNNNQDVINAMLSSKNMLGVCRHHNAVLSYLISSELGLEIRGLIGHTINNQNEISAERHIKIEVKLDEQNSCVVDATAAGAEDITIKKNR